MCAAAAKAIPRVQRYQPYAFEKPKADLMHAYPHLIKGAELTDKTVEVARQLLDQITQGLQTLASTLDGLEGDARQEQIRQFAYLQDNFAAYSELVERVEIFVRDLNQATQLYNPKALLEEHTTLISRLSKGIGKQVSQLLTQSTCQFELITTNHTKFQEVLVHLQEKRESKRVEVTNIFDLEDGSGNDWEVVDAP